MYVQALPRRVTTGLCAVLATLGSAPAFADPAQPNHQLPPALVQAVARDLQIDTAEYLNRAEKAHQLADFAISARTAYSGSFAGVRMDGEKAVVALTDGTGHGEARKAAEAGRFVVETVAETEVTLHRHRSDFEKWLAAQPESLTHTITGYGIDVERNAVVIEAVEHTQLPREAGPVQLLPSVPLEAGPELADPDLDPAAEATPRRQFIGGTEYIAETGGIGVRCTLGFNGTAADGRPVNITAGHCDPSTFNDETKAAGHGHVFKGVDGKRREVGTFSKSQSGRQGSAANGRDYGIIRINDSFADRFSNNVVSTKPLVPGGGRPPSGSFGGGSNGGSGWRPPSGSAAGQAINNTAAEDATVHITGVAMNPVQGAPLCKTGVVTGFTCGHITGVGKSYRTRGGVPSRVKELDDMIGTDLCAHQGDSGGPVFIGTKALGISSAGQAGGPAPACGPSPILAVEPMRIILEQNEGLKVNTK